MKFRVGQKVRIIDSGIECIVTWVDVFGGQFYRLDNNFLYTESEVEAVEAEQIEDIED